jgi:hypothetical protein
MRDIAKFLAGFADNQVFGMAFTGASTLAAFGIAIAVLL